MAMNLFDYFRGKSKKKNTPVNNAFSSVPISTTSSYFNLFGKNMADMLQGPLTPNIPVASPSPTEVTPDNLFIGPINPIQYPKTPTSDNWSKVIRIAYTASKIYGIPPQVILSQMGTESERGLSEAARLRNNYFGYQAYDSNPNSSRVFKDPYESINAYGRLITQDDRYKPAMALKDNPRAMIQAIKDGGYATDPDYVWKITNTPEWRAFE